MARHKSDEEKPPKGGWLGPPSSFKVPALAMAKGSKKGKWLWKENKLSTKDKKKRAKFEDKMKKADKKGQWKI